MNTPKPLMHFTPAYFLNPVHPIKVTLIGAGGNGSQMLSALARIDYALRQLGKMGLEVTVWDPDTVEPSNVGRQLFSTADIGQNKADCLVSRFNRVYGNNWKAIPEEFRHTYPGNSFGNIIITCVDNKKVRMEIGKYFPIEKKKLAQNEYYPFYWLDLGNGQRTGQVILGSNPIDQPETEQYQSVNRLPTLTDTYDLEQVDEKESGPSCSLAEALSKQDLFINSSLVQMAASLLWSVFTDYGIEYQGFYMNLDTYRTIPIPVKKYKTPKPKAKTKKTEK